MNRTPREGPPAARVTPRRLPAGWWFASLAAATLLGVAGSSRLQAQYPNVPPPLPCDERGAEWDPAVFDPITSRVARLAIIPFRSSLTDDDSASTGMAMAFTQHMLERVADLHAVMLWPASPDINPPGTDEIVALGKANHVAHLMYGRIDGAQHGITLSAKMFETARGQLEWNLVLTGSMSDLPAFEDVLVRGIGEHLRPGRASASSIAARPSSTTRVAAYLRYLRGMAALSNAARGEAAQANEEFQAAIRLDSAYGAAWAGLALSTVAEIQRDGMASSNAASAATDVAVSAIRRAVRLAPQSAVVWTARGAILQLVEPRDYTQALAAYRKAIELSPWDADAHRLLGQALLELGSTDAALEQFHLALSDDRGDPATLVAVGVMHLRARRYHDACRALNAAVADEPRYAEAYAERALARLHLKDIRSAYGDAETAVRLGAWLTGTVAQVLADVDARDSAGAKTRIAALVAAQPRKMDHPSVWEGHYLAEGYAALGKNDRALELLSHAAPRGASLWLALQDPAFDRLRGESRYASLMDDSRPFGGP
jgi:tetratricopeptide (TPR) repeat protein